VASKAFSAETLPLGKAPADNFREDIIENCRDRYSVTKEVIEKKIADQMNKKETVEQKVARRGEMPLEKVLGSRQPATEERPQQNQARNERPVREKTEVNIGDLQKAIEEALKEKKEE